ncbi:SDR family oxidoreductase [Kitasatospora sp. NBC_01250]|uniref:SDR family oxidoreductase n=1 Tax=unclassified Kitasatospora TaxID=2633591 RepID=UPI002E12E4FA|nr:MULTISPECIES: SDR family oxidoreductase [unclassified Kitasatospora]WSJ67904.1 SDR family oxidoreductase [Kitasatospora sp. NBC_01302]
MTITSYPELAGRTAVITGAASGMGEATARLLAAGGARVALLARRADRLTELAEKITLGGGQALVVPVDITDQAAVDAAAAQVRAAFGRADLVVNSAGVMLPNPVAEGRTDEWTRMIDTNLTGALRVINAFRDDLVAVAAEGGTADLVNVSSIGAHSVYRDFAVYSATKAALTHLSTVLRAEFGPLDVRVTNIEPGLTRTELGSHIDNAGISAVLDGMFESIPPLTSEDIADLIGWTASRRRGVNLRQAMILPTRQV